MKLLIIADDFTGALDTGVQLASRGIKTLVVTVPFSEGELGDPEVLVVDAESRHLSPKEAYRTVSDIVESLKDREIPYIYKKTDSALRGNIGAELAAVMDATGRRQLAFIPGHPAIRRVTRGGVHYINDVPVSESSFGKEIFNPVLHSDVAGILGEQTDKPVFLACANCPRPGERGITVYDAESPEELSRIGDYLKGSGIRLFSGCAGFGSVLPAMLGFAEREVVRPQLDERLFVLCGSIHPVTQNQVKRGVEYGYVRLIMTPEEKLSSCTEEKAGEAAVTERLLAELAAHPYVILDSNDPEDDRNASARWAAERGIDIEETRSDISRTLGDIFKKIYDSPELGTILITGGDVLQSCMKQLGISRMEPICEVAQGTVLARFELRGRVRYVITKSGGFGQESLLEDLARMLASQKEERS